MEVTDVGASSHAYQMPLLALIGATAAYVGALRLWYHKLRMDAGDAVLTQQANRAAGQPAVTTVHHEARYRRAVLWLRVLMVVDVLLISAALALYKVVFRPWMPRQNWDSAQGFDGFALTVQLGLAALIFVAGAHVIAGASAWYLPTRFGGARSWTQAQASGGIAIVVLLATLVLI
jgi:hypothetical protein